MSPSGTQLGFVMGNLQVWHFLDRLPCTLDCVIKTILWSCKMDKYWPSYGQNKSERKFFQIWTIMPSSFSL
jgi:hypothetical protein